MHDLKRALGSSTRESAEPYHNHSSIFFGGLSITDIIRITSFDYLPQEEKSVLIFPLIHGGTVKQWGKRYECTRRMKISFSDDDVVGCFARDCLCLLICILYILQRKRSCDS